MARVTVEDCLVHIPSRFDLTLIAAKRARQLARGAEARLPWDDHKSTVLALQEIASGRVGASILAEPELPMVQRPAVEFEPLDPDFPGLPHRGESEPG
jgi:DNA-directed RNA polymerase subunit omega